MQIEMKKIRTEIPTNTNDTIQSNMYKGVGEYRIGGIGDTNYISFTLSKKPHPFHRMMVRFFFGLRWIDYKPKTE